MVFISPQKLFFFSRYLSFCLDFFGHVAKQLDKKNQVDFKFYDVTNWLRNNCNTHIAKISRSAGNHTMKFGQLEWNDQQNVACETFFLENHAQNVVEKLVLDPFLKN